MPSFAVLLVGGVAIGRRESRHEVGSACAPCLLCSTSEYWIEIFEGYYLVSYTQASGVVGGPQCEVWRCHEHDREALTTHHVNNLGRASYTVLLWKNTVY